MAGILFNVPNTYPSGSPAVWYDLSTLNGLSDGDPITSVPDLSGNEENTSALGTITFKTNIQNGLSIARFPGIASNYLRNLTFSSSAQPITIFVVFKYSDPIGAPWWISDSSDGPYLTTSAGKHALYAGSSWASSIDYNTTNFVLATIIFNGASSSIRINGVSGGVGNPGTDEFDTGLHIGASHSGSNVFNGDLGEFLLYNNLEDPTTNEAKLIAKWGV